MPILIYKKVGETPLEAINRLRLENNKLEKERLSYAGRLDPLAEGLLLILVGDECDESSRKKFLGLDKEYDIEVLFGISTDSYDLLGLPELSNITEERHLLEEIEKAIPEYVGKGHNLKYPPFSSKTINGKSLFELAKLGEIETSDLPPLKGTIKSIEILGSRALSLDEVLATAQDQILKVRGDFRQKEIINVWNSLEKVDYSFHIVNLRVRCESGVYMRSLAKNLGERIGPKGLAFSIKRTQIGDYLA